MSGGPTPVEFAGRTLVVATMHGKEAVIAPALEAVLGVRCVVADGLDTDAFGTFTREVPRRGSPRDAARDKARAAMVRSGVALAVASEGSFGPDPRAPIVTLAHELVLLVDAERGLEIVGEDLGHDTNYAERACADVAAIEAFAARVGFPEHRLILASPEPTVATDPERREFVKAIGAWGGLREAGARLLRRHGGVVVSTDMRACHNPTRMRAIGRAAADLAARAATPCPRCGRPGFGRVAVERGLPCADCGTPTELVRGVVDGCDGCGHTLERPRPDRRATADPAACPLCNP